MSVRFVSAVTGEDAGAISLKERSLDRTASMHDFLGRGAFLFSYIIRTDPIGADQDVVDDMVGGPVTVNFLKPAAVTFNFYFQEASTQGMCRARCADGTWQLCYQPGVLPGMCSTPGHEEGD